MDAIELYDGPAPGSENWTQGEQRYFSEALDTEVITNVATPTITPVLPAAGLGNGGAVIIAPGGGYHVLSIQSEGFEVAERLAEHGISAFVLAYRLVQCEGDAVAEMAGKATGDFSALSTAMNQVAPLAAADAEAAVRLVRARADDFGIDPGRVGFMGFSAGGNVTVRVALTDDPAARPDFIAPIYATLSGIDLGVAPDGSGPMFLVAATDDELGLARDSIALYDTWRRARLPVELHLYARGGHGFGMRTQHLPSDRWIDRFLDWFDATDLDAR
ncbi:MAG TPA: alpha/beta hydrolase [Ilumatobacteraceae bacterium]|nr:alpha/beta hydrolase [Ilumatobacteraceae bacterium]